MRSRLRRQALKKASCRLSRSRMESNSPPILFIVGFPYPFCEVREDAFSSRQVSVFRERWRSPGSCFPWCDRRSGRESDEDEKHGCCGDRETTGRVQQQFASWLHPTQPGTGWPDCGCAVNTIDEPHGLLRSREDGSQEARESSESSMIRRRPSCQGTVGTVPLSSSSRRRWISSSQAASTPSPFGGSRLLD